MANANFLNPSKEFRPAPFWSWNGTMIPAEVKRQITLMHEQGFGGFFMHSRIGLETPYMSNEWMQAIEAGIDGAKHYDMEAWFYDEDKWPSGFAGGIVPALGDAYRLKGLTARIIDAAKASDAWAQQEVGTKNTWQVLFELKSDGDRLVNYTQLDQPPIEASDSTYLLCQLYIAPAGEEWYNGQSYVDLMDRQVTEAFIKCTHEAYKARFGDQLGPNVPGIFTDEPNISPKGNNRIPWTTAFAQRFEELWGYDIIKRLPLLFLEGEGSSQVRHDYWATVTILFRDNFSIPFGEWCKNNGIAMTGHYLLEDSLVAQTQNIGAAMPHYPSQQLPGIDHLGRNINDPLTLKQVSSVAHQMGQKRVLCEIFGVAGHSMSFADQKWISDFHFALGISFLNPHLTLYSSLGERKRDYPANISWVQPYWPEYRTFNDYAGRCSWFVQQGDFQADILLLHPIGSAWALIPGKCEGANYADQIAKAQSLNGKFLTVFNALLATHRDFDLGDELVMADYARVEGSELCVGQMRYKVVVLPYSSVLAPNTVELLQKFTTAGGKVYVVGENTPIDVIPVPDATMLVATLDVELPRSVSIECASGQQAPALLYQHRVDGEQHYYFLANTDRHVGATARVRLDAAGVVTVFDLTSGEAVNVSVGEASPFPWAAIRVIEANTSGVMLEWQAPPAGSLAFSVGPKNLADNMIISSGTAPGKAAIAMAQSENPAPAAAWYPGFPGKLASAQVQQLSGPWQFERLHPNVMTLDYCQAAIGDNPLSNEFAPVPAVRAEVMRVCGRKTMTQPYIYLTGTLPSQPVPVKLQFQFLVEEVPTTLALVVEKPEKLSVLVNGRPATQRAFNAAGTDMAQAWLNEPGYGALDVHDLVQPGENTITLTFTADVDEADVEEIYLLGDFGVWQKDNRFYIGPEPKNLAPGSWVEQGYPFYSGTMRYSIPLGASTKWLDLSSAAASLLCVSVNGHQIRLPWQPWVVDVHRYMQLGENRAVVDVISSLRNAFGPLHHKLGDELPWVGPAQFTVNKAHWTDEYQFAPYGLLAPVLLA